jgi:hypothetical protein
MNPTQLFIAEKTEQALRALEGVRVRAQQERSLLGLALLVSRVQVNQLVRPLPRVRAALFRLHAQTQRHAARLASEQVTRYQAQAHSPDSTNALDATIRACSGVFPREAALLRRCCVAV